MEGKDELATFRHSPYLAVAAILSKLGAPVEEHTGVTMGTIMELTMEGKVL